jgi:hypothetical protein
MKPSHITTIMDTALAARKEGEVFNPMFTGEAGLGKSQIVQQWVKKQRDKNPNFGFIDLRIAYMEAPDLIGLPENEVTKDGGRITSHYQPDFWPRDPESEGLILLEEPNRGTTGVMNCLMQLLTDRKVHKYELPKGWLIAACINPDSDKYDVNTMDTALKDRFEEFEVEYDALSFLEFMEASGWDDNIQRFVGDGLWIYKASKELGQNGKYISPRTWSKVNAAEKANIRSNRNLHRIVVNSILGKDIGNEYHKYCFDQAPVTAADLLKDAKAALAKLREHSQPDTYKGDMIAATVESIIKAYGGVKKDCKQDQIDEDLMADVAKIIPADMAVQLLKGCGFKVTKGKMSDFLNEFVKRHPDLIDVLRANLKLSRATGVDKDSALDKK